MFPITGESDFVLIILCDNLIKHSTFQIITNKRINVYVFRYCCGTSNELLNQKISEVDDLLKTRFGAKR